LPVRSQETVKLKMFDEPMPELAEQRAVQMVELGAKDGPGLWFLCTSLDYRWESKEQFESARTIKELVAKHDKELAIMACTLHANPGNRTIREFAKEWKVAGMDRAGAKVQGEGEGDRKKSRYLLTYPSDKPDSWADFIMCRPAARWRVVELRVIEEKVASNHRPVLAVLRRVDEERVEKVAK
jgi:endonuclease/exonuclease/phosphatase family metal-dependent hydrolase